MQVVQTREEIRALRRLWSQAQVAATTPTTGSGAVGVVMTMGALHAGHAALLDAASAECDHVLVTIFVNPLQFGSNEDLTRYPRPLTADLELCREHGVDAVFTPTVNAAYGTIEPGIRVQGGPLGSRWEGAARPGHFDGMLTVVLTLLHLTTPDRAYFGRKDAQQLDLIGCMVTELGVDCQIIEVATVRDADGLALSSRNAYLSPSERAVARAIPRALQAGVAAAGRGSDAVTTTAQAVFAAQPGCHVDYLAVVNRATWTAVPADYQGDALLITAARVGTTRLIDNMPLTVGQR